MSRKWTIPLFLAAIVLLPVTVFGIVKWYEGRFQPLPVVGPAGHRVAGFSFTDQHATIVTDGDWNGRIVVANFFFTHCPSVCPRMTAQLKRVQAALGPGLYICSFTVDPERDSVPVLSRYAEQFGIAGNWHLLTGEKTALYRLARKGLQLVATDGDGGPQDFIHSENLVLIDPLKRLRGFYRGTDPSDVDRLIGDLTKLKKEFDQR